MPNLGRRQSDAEPSNTLSSVWSQTIASDPTSLRLLARIHRGDSGALDQLFARYLPRLHQWAHGRLARWVRVDVDTPDLVQDVLLHSIGPLHALQPRSRDALRRYFRAAVKNRIRDEHRRYSRRSAAQLSSALDVIDRVPSTLDRLIDDEQRMTYRSALAGLHEDDRELIVGHIELGYTHAQLGCMTDRTPNAARMALYRAVGRLAGRMNER